MYSFMYLDPIPQEIMIHSRHYGGRGLRKVSGQEFLEQTTTKLKLKYHPIHCSRIMICQRNVVGRKSEQHRETTFHTPRISGPDRREEKNTFRIRIPDQIGFSCFYVISIFWCASQRTCHFRFNYKTVSGEYSPVSCKKMYMAVCEEVWSVCCWWLGWPRFYVSHIVENCQTHC